MMITQRMLGRAGLLALAAGLVFSLSLPAVAGGGGFGSGGTGAGQGEEQDAGDDDIGTLPDEAPDDFPSILFMGTRSQISGVILDVHGTGSIILRPLFPGSDLIALEFEGDFDLRVDLAALEAGAVIPVFGAGTNFTGGAAWLHGPGIETSAHVLPTLGMVELPLASFGADRGGPVSLHAMSLERDVYGLRMSAMGEVMTLTQRLR